LSTAGFVKHIPNALSLSRIIGSPLVLLPFIQNSPLMWLISSVSFVVLSLTDFFDGWVARKYNVESNFGKFFDPAGDKILVLLSLVVLMHFKLLNPFILIILLSRDVIIGSIRSFSASAGLVLSARPLGKLKTVLQMIGLPLLLAPTLWTSSRFYSQNSLGLALVWSACGLSLISLIDYALVLNTSLKSIDKKA
jgi:CDP-diacylglycerol--glycerol-3-phosphate 3-phosphatidyltransferase